MSTPTEDIAAVDEAAMDVLVYMRIGQGAEHCVGSVRLTPHFCASLAALLIEVSRELTAPSILDDLAQAMDLPAPHGDRGHR